MSVQPLLSVSSRLRSTPFTSRTIERGARAFTVYNHMLLATEFEDLQSDYWHLCKHVQVWDVGAERQVSLKGPDAQKLLQWMTPRSIANIDTGRCVYIPLVDERGKLVNDPVALKLADDHWWVSIADSDVLLWAKGLAFAAGLQVSVHEPQVWPLAIQGPKADALMRSVFGAEVDDIRFFRFRSLPFNGHHMQVARSGWSKQGGFEVYVDDPEIGMQLYDVLFEQEEALDVRAGCPNLIERMESGLLSFGNDMTSDHSPIEAGMTRFFKLDETLDAIGMQALLAEQQQPPQRKLMGLVVTAEAGPAPISVASCGNILLGASGDAIGTLGSQCWSPRYEKQLATVMLDAPYFDQNALPVNLADGSHAEAQVLPIPFEFAAAGIHEKRT